MEQTEVVPSFDRYLLLMQSENADDHDIGRFLSKPDGFWIDAISKNPNCKSAVLLNKRLGIAVLEILAADRDPQIRASVASRRKVGAHRPVALVLARDEDSRVRLALAGNPKLLRDVEEILLADSDQFVRDTAEHAGRRRRS